MKKVLQLKNGTKWVDGEHINERLCAFIEPSGNKVKLGYKKELNGEIISTQSKVYNSDSLRNKLQDVKFYDDEYLITFRFSFIYRTRSIVMVVIQNE